MTRPLVEILKALADDVRLRILGVLGREPLSVNEIRDILGFRQSRCSRHLQILARAGLVEGARDGTRIYYAIHPEVERSAELSALLAAIGVGSGGARFPVPALHPETDAATLKRPREMKRDYERLTSHLSERKRDAIQHFQAYGQDQDRLQRGLVDSDFYRDRILALLPEDPGVAVDLGCGSGELSRLLANRTPRLICVDQSPNMLERARQRVESPRAEYRIGALEHLPLGDGEADTVVASMVLHHMPDPLAALREIRRALRPGGTLILAELDHHEEEVMRTRFADFWLGFPSARLQKALAESGFRVMQKEGGRGAGELDCLFFVAKTEGRARREPAPTGRARKPA